jgi:hypothetical protein
MECRTARLLVEFARPAAGDLASADFADLERHLAGCPECEEYMRTEGVIDQHLGKAMRAVEVPDRLRARLHSKLSENCQRGSSRRRLKWIAFAGSAAALLLVGLGIYLWQSTHLPAVDVEEAWLNGNRISAAMGPEEIEQYFQQRGVTVVAPLFYNYDYLTCVGMSPFQGKQVPQLTFYRPDKREYAHVYLVTSKQFDLKSLKQSVSDDGYKFKIMVRYEEGSTQAFIVLHTGQDLKWLDPTNAPERF